MYQFYNPVRTYIGNGCFANMPTIIQQAVGTPKSIALIVWSDSVLSISAVAHFMETAPCEVHPIVFDKANPTVENLYELNAQTSGIDYDLVVAIGGGSVLDVAKTLACIKDMDVQSEEDVRTIITEKTYQPPKCNWIGVPTTAGTGSEATCWATIWDMTKGKKLSVERQDNYAVAAVVDASFIATMPKALAVSSALDAVAHATESFWAKDRNPVTQGLAISAIRTIMDAMDGLLQDYGNPTYFDAMATGSMLAGLAFSNTHTTACHSLSYPLTMHFGVPHGVAVSMLIAPMMVFNQGHLEKIELLLSAFGVESMGALEEKINAILAQANIKATLQQWGVRQDDIGFLTENAFTKGRIDNNPKALTKEDVSAIFKGIY